MRRRNTLSKDLLQQGWIKIHCSKYESIIYTPLTACPLDQTAMFNTVGDFGRIERK